MPHRVATGPGKGELEWRRPNRITLSNLLHHPLYAGVYVCGRRPTDPGRQQAGRPGTGRTGSRQVFLPDRVPAYISWEQWTLNRKQMEDNQVEAFGAIRQGPSLLSGLLVCGRCGLKMATTYQQNGRGLRYACGNAMSNYGESLCQSLSGTPLDHLVSAWVLKALEPAALEISLQAVQDLEDERRQLHQHWALYTARGTRMSWNKRSKSHNPLQAASARSADVSATTSIRQPVPRIAVRPANLPGNNPQAESDGCGRLRRSCNDRFPRMLIRSPCGRASRLCTQ